MSLSHRFIAGPGEEVVFLLAREQGPAAANVLIVPPYGRSAQDLFFLAYFLSCNGLNTYRFDARHHVGRSSGVIEDFRLSELEADVVRVANELRRGSTLPLILVGLSLSAPVAWKVAASAPDVLGVVSIVGTVDVPFTLNQIGTVPFDMYRRRPEEAPEYQDMLGYRIKARPFVADAVRNGYGSFEEIRGHVQRVPGPCHMIAGAEDPWVRVDDVRQCHRGATSGSELLVLEKVTHEFTRSLSVTKQVTTNAVRLCLSLCGGAPADIVTPNLVQVLSASAAEAAALEGPHARAPEVEPRVLGVATV
jgi:pimeloyl-ACP methyl ester carboxylesterase